MSKEKGNVYMIPMVIAENTADKVILPAVQQIIKQTDYYLVENIRTARRFISSLKLGKVIEKIQFELIDSKTAEGRAKKLLQPAIKGRNIGIMSEAGSPGIADPGANVALVAHQLSLRVIPLVGPSSIFLALMASGLNGQCFKFHGYLAIDKVKRTNKLKVLESESYRFGQTQLFMETPYRNEQLFDQILLDCKEDTFLCIATNVTGSDEFIDTKTIRNWKKKKPSLHKKPTMFLLFRQR